jgi:hypothetical protein
MVAPKKRKDGMPKKHDPKKRKKKKGVAMSQKKRETWMIRERKTNALRSKPHPSIHPYIHPLIHLHLLIEIA